MKTDEFISNEFCEKYISANSYHPTIETTWSMRLLPHTTILPGYDVPSPKRLCGLYLTELYAHHGIYILHGYEITERAYYRDVIKMINANPKF